MRAILIISVLVTIKFVYGAHIGFNDNVENPENKAGSDHYEKFIGNPKKYKTSIKEFVDAKYKKRCDTCRESHRCKVMGKCDYCTRICKDVDSTTLPPPTRAPLLGNIQAYIEDETPITESSGRYYTIGTLRPGPKKNLIARLVNKAKKKSWPKLKGGDGDDPEHPVIIEKVFPKVHAQKNGADLALTSKIGKELNAVRYGKTSLANEEVDGIFEKVLPPQQNFVELGSRFNLITTKRSVSNWPEEKQAFKPIKRTITESPNEMVGSPYFAGNLERSREDGSEDFLSPPRNQIDSPRNQKLESASQHLDPAEEAVTFEEPEDLIVTLTQAPEMYTNDSDPIVGSNWFTDEVDKAKDWWKENVGMETPSQNKINLINATHFTTILKNLEDKVENIADLVKKTCGPAEEPNLGQEAPELESRNPVNQIQVFDTQKDGSITKKPHVLLDSAMRDLNQGADYLINKAVKLADRLEKIPFGPKRVENKPILEAAPERPILGQANADRQIFATDEVGCKEESEEYVGEAPKTTTDPTVACKEDSEEYVGEKLLSNNLKTEPAEEEVGCKEDSEEYLGARPKTEGEDVESGKNGATEEEKGKVLSNPALEESKVPLNPEEVGEAKKEPSEEAVGCSKEEEEEEYLVPVYQPQGYNPYRESDGTKSEPPKHKLPHLPTLDELLHRPNRLRDGSLLNPLKKHGLFNHADAPQEANHANLAEELPTNSDFNGPLPKHSKFDQESGGEHPTAHGPNFPEEAPFDVNQSVRNQKIENIPKTKLQKIFIPPPLHQRFGENQDNWAPQDQVLGVKKDLEASTINPFTIFGKVVPQSKNNEKLYFLGKGIKIPLNMKRDEDGSYSLTLDMDQLCSKCKKCEKNIGDEEEPNGRLGMEPPHEEKDEFKVEITPHEEGVTEIVHDTKKIEEGEASSTHKQERKQIKRSPAFVSLHNSKGVKEGVPDNSLQVDASLKKIDDDMKRYFDRRQKLDDFYKDQVRRSLENPDEGKDIVKRRVKLVNNVLSWMKSIANVE